MARQGVADGGVGALRPHPGRSRARAGRRAVELLLDYAPARLGARRLLVSYAPGDG